MKTQLHRIAATTLALSFFAHAEEEYGPDGYIYEYQLGTMWRKDKGLMFMGNKEKAKEANEKDHIPEFEATDGSIDNRRTLYTKEYEQFCVTFRLQDQFNYKDESTGPATFDWSHVAGKGDFWAADASLRADFWIPAFYHPDGAEMSLALGYDIDRSVTDSGETNLQTFHLAVPFVPKDIFRHIPFLEKADQVFQADVTYTRDEVSGDDGFDFETDYSPVFKLPYGWIGTPCDFNGKALDTDKFSKNPYYSIDPKVGLSYGERYQLGSPTANLNDEFVLSYSISGKLAFQMGDKEALHPVLATFMYALKGGESLDSGANFNYQELSLEFKPADNSNLSLKLAYKNGASTFAEVDTEEVSVAVGASF